MTSLTEEVVAILKKVMEEYKASEAFLYEVNDITIDGFGKGFDECNRQVY